MSFFDDASLVFLPSGQAGKDGKAYSMKPTDGSGDFTFSRGSNLTATRVDSNGLIQKGRENLFKQSNNFDTTPWASSVTLTSGQSGYDGSNDAWLLTKTSSGAQSVYNYINETGVMTMSVYAKAGSTNWMRLTQGGKTAYFDLSGSGAVGTSSNGIDQTITSIGNGWFRCTLTANKTTAGQTPIYPYTAEGDASGSTDSIYIQDSQFEQGLIATEPILSGATTGLAGILEDSPRFDYSGGASCPSLLLEGSRTNLVRSSEALINGSYGWTLGNATTLTLNDAISPEGVQNAFRLDIPTGNNTTLVRCNILESTQYTFSFYVKRGTATELKYSVFNFSSLGNIVATTSYFSQTNTSEFVRIIVNFTTPAGCTDVGCYLDRDSGANGSAWFYGIQLEEGSYPTSYIPNHSGGSVTREADDSTLSSIINGDAAFTFMIESGIQDYGSSVPKYFDAGALGYINHNTSNILRYRFGGSNYVQSISGLDSFKFLLRYDRSEIKVYFNGSLEHTISASLSGSIGLSLLGGLNKQVLLFPTDLPLNQCITLTS